MNSSQTLEISLPHQVSLVFYYLRSRAFSAIDRSVVILANRSRSGRTPNDVYAAYTQLTSSSILTNKRKEDFAGPSPIASKKPRHGTNGLARGPKTPAKLAASPATNGTPGTGDGEQKRKRGRPSKADLAARAAAAGGDVASPQIKRDSPAGSATPLANMAGDNAASPASKRRGRPTKSELLLKQVLILLLLGEFIC